MNSSSFTQTIKSLDYWFEAYGIPTALNKLYVYMLIPINIITLGIDLFSFVVLFKRPFLASIFYKYIKVYFLNSIIICLFLITAFVCITHGVFDFTNSYATLFYGCFFFAPLLSTFYLNGSLIEISMVIERCLYFLPPKYKKIKVVSFNNYCLLLLIASGIINWPLYFILIPAYIDVAQKDLDQITAFRIYYWAVNTSFSNTLHGNIILYILYFIRDILPLVTKIILNIFLVNLVKKYLKKLKIEKIEFSNRISTSMLQSDFPPSMSKNSAFLSKADRNQTISAICMCIFSLFEHMFYILSYILYFLGNSYVSNIIYYVVLVSLTLKHGCNFFIFYNFNYLFRVEVKKSLKI